MTNNRFRFRVWDTESKELIYDAENAYDYMHLCTGGRIIAADCFGDILANKRYIVEQCTGLKDKNGRLIYEGDIVKFYDECYEIFFQDYTAAFKPVSTEGLCIFMSDNEKMEVVGNIHENPKLLEVQK